MIWRLLDSMKITFACLILLLAFSCTTPKDYVYFQGKNANGQPVPADLKAPEFNGLIVKSDDILAIQVSSVNAKVSQPYNITGGVEQTGQLIRDFLVDADGNIDYPGIGTVAVAGLRVKEVKARLLEKIQPYVTDAVINVRIQNFKLPF